jgi:hypothetical protein
MLSGTASTTLSSATASPNSDMVAMKKDSKARIALANCVKHGTWDV